MDNSHAHGRTLFNDMKTKLLYLLLLLLPLRVGAQEFDTIVCSGELPFVWNGLWVAVPGDFTATLTAADGGDSVVTLHVTVLATPTVYHTPDQIILPGETVDLAAIVSAGTADLIIWTDADGNILGEGDELTVTPTASTTYYLYCNSLDNMEAASVVSNGTFEQGNTAFTSAYTYHSNTGSQALWDEGTYAVGTNASSYHMYFQNRTDHTSGTGNYMIINGATVPNVNVWTQTATVEPHTQYAFSVWVCSLSSENLAQLQFSVNGEQVGPIFTAPAVADGWARYYEVWSSEENTSALITVLNQNNGQSGNDFGIDDISFCAISTCAKADSIRVQFYTPVIDTTVCDSQLPFYWRGHTVDSAGSYVSELETSAGPKTVTLNVTVHPSYLIEVTDTICYHQSYSRYGLTVDAPQQGSDAWYTTSEFYLNDTLPTVHGCDSVADIHLTRMGCPRATLGYDIDCLTGLSTITADASVDWGQSDPQGLYMHWDSSPRDELLDTVADSATTIVVRPPEKPTIYSLTVDYRQPTFCPTSAHLQLSPVLPPQAIVRLVPEVLTNEAHEFDAYDASVLNDEDFPAEYHANWQRRWYIDGEEQASRLASLHYSIPADSDVDSVTVGLKIFNGECADSTWATIHTIAVSVSAPNAFTPDEESNNLFKLFTRGVIEGELFIYSREGFLIYHTDDFHQGWDGRDSDGRPCRQSNYVWFLQYRAADYPSTLRTKTGTVLLLR